MKKLLFLFALIWGFILIGGINASAAVSQVTPNQVNLSNSNVKSAAKDGLGNYYVTFSGAYSSYNHIFVRKSTDGGATWKYWDGSNFVTGGSEVPIETTGSYNQYNPTIAIDGGNNVHVAWTGTSASYPGTYQLRYSKFNGTTWSAPVDITNGYYQYNPSIAVDGNNNVHIVWHGYSAVSPSNYQIRYATYNGSWSSPIDITSESSYQYYPTLAVDGSNNIHVVWFGTSSTSASYTQVRYAKYNGSWSTPVNITSGNYNQCDSSISGPSIAIDSSNNLHVAWFGYSPASPSSWQIRYTKYNGSWSAPLDVTSGSGSRRTPSIEVDSSDNLHLMWINGSQQFWYSKYITSWMEPAFAINYSGSYSMGSPILIKGAQGFVWQGSATGDTPSIVANGQNGVVFAGQTTLNLLADRLPGAPTLADIANNDDARDMRVSFTGAADETNISGYRIIVVSAYDVPSFTQSSANSTSSPKYYSEAKNGNSGSHTVTLTQSVFDYRGATIASGVPYKAYVLAIGQNGYQNIISDGSSYLTLSIPTPFPAPDVNRVVSTYSSTSGNNGRKIAKDGLGNYYIAFNSSSNVYVRKSDDGGVTWKYWNGTSYGVSGQEIGMEPGTLTQGQPSIVADSSNNIHLVWNGRSSITSSNNQIRYSRFNGTSWSVPIDITSVYYQQAPSIDIDSSNNLYVVWSGNSSDSPSTYQIRYAKYNGSWSTPIDITAESYYQYAPSVAVDSLGKVHVVWYGSSATSTSVIQIRYAKYDGSWSTPVDLTSEVYQQETPSIAVDSSNNLHVVWDGRSPNVNSSYEQIRYMKYNGTSWSAITDITKVNARHVVPTIAVDNSNVIHVVWYGTIPSFSVSYQQIWYARYKNGSWTAQEAVTVYTSNIDTTNPSISKDASAFAWQGFTSGSVPNIVPSNSYGIMFATQSTLIPLAERLAGIPTVSDIADNGDGRVIRVTFNGAEGETNISQYRIYVVPSTVAGTLVIGNISGASSSYYVAEAKSGNGSLHTVTLTQGLIDSTGASIINGVPYKVFIIAKGQNGFIDTMTQGSNILTLASPIPSPAPAANKITSLPITTAGNSRYVAKDSAGNFYIAYAATYNGNTNIFVRKSDTMGVTWQYWNGSAFGATGAELPIEVIAYGQNSPTLGIDASDNIHLIWLGTTASSPGYSQVRYSKFDGTSWSTPVNITSTNYYKGNVAFDFDSSWNIHSVWAAYTAASPSYYQINYSKYNGTNWSAPISLTSESYNQNEPVIVVDGSNNLHVAWYGRSSTSTTYEQIRYAKYNGTSWSTPADLTNDNYDQRTPYISVDSSNNVYVTWSGVTSTSGGFIVVRYNKYNGTSWAGAVTVPNTTGFSNKPVLEVDSSGNIHVAWRWGNSTTQIYYTKYTNSWSTPIAITSGTTYSQQYPMLVKGAFALIWTGTTDGTGVSINDKGLMFYQLIASTPAPSAGTPTGADIANNGDGRDIRVTFNGATNETNIASYRIYVVPTAQAGTFSASTAAGLAAARYVAEPKSGNGNAHTVTLSQSLLDSAGAAIVNNSTYKIFILGIGQNGYLSSLSAGSLDLTLQAIAPTPGTPTASDIANNGDGRDIRVTFTGASDETNISGYRIFVVPSNQSGAFNVSTASGLAAARYSAKSKSGNSAANTATLTQSLQNSAGAAIVNGTYYKIFVLALGQNGFMDSLSAGSTDFRLTLGTAPAVQAPLVYDIGNNGDASDLKVAFRGASTELTINEYRVIVVPAAQSGSFNASTASGLASDKYVQVAKAGAKSVQMVTLPSILLDSNGDPITNSVQYKVFVLSVGLGNYGDSLSQPSVAITLTGTVTNATSIGRPVAEDVSNNNNASDIKVTFKSVRNEVNVASYKIFVVPSASAGSFNLTAANTAITGGYAQTESKTGSNTLHTLTLGQTLRDTAGTLVANGRTYKIFVLTVGLTGYGSTLSLGSADLTLSSSSSVLPTMSTPTVRDTANYGDGSDITVTFKALAHEENILEYRIMVVPDTDAGAFNVTSASALASTSYVSKAKLGSRRSHSITLRSNLQDSNGDAIAEGTAYRIFVLAVASSGSSILSSQSSAINLTATTPSVSAVKAPYVLDISNNGNASDIQVKFKAVLTETNVQEYRIIVSTTVLSQNTASGLAAARYMLEAKTTKGAAHTVLLDPSLLNSAGSAITNGVTYKIYVLTVGKNSYADKLSSPSLDLILN